MIIRVATFTLCVALLVSLFDCSPPYRSGGTLNTVQSISYSRGQATIALAQTARVFWTEGQWGNRFYIDLQGCRVGRKGRRQVRDTFIEEYHWAQNDRNTVRVVLTLVSGGNVRVRQSGDQILMIVGGAPSQERREREERKFVVLIDPGHGGQDPGAEGPSGTYEKDVCLDIASKLAELFSKRRGIKAYLTRDEDVTLSLDARRNIAKRVRPDLFVSIHLNASRQRGKNQAEVYYYSPSSRGIAEQVGESLMRALRMKRLVVGKKGLHVLKNNAARYAILVEPMHLSNYAVERHLKQEWYRKQVAAALQNALLDFLKSQK